MGEVVKFVTRAELERARLNRESRRTAILPPAVTVSEQRDEKSELADS